MFDRGRHAECNDLVDREGDGYTIFRRIVRKGGGWNWLRIV
jgi:hypothetical protein